jgi:hypothetical protein
VCGYIEFVIAYAFVLFLGWACENVGFLLDFWDVTFLGVDGRRHSNGVWTRQ